MQEGTIDVLYEERTEQDENGKELENSYVYMYRYEGVPVYIGIGTNSAASANYARANATTHHDYVLEAYDEKI